MVDLYKIMIWVISSINLFDLNDLYDSTLYNILIILKIVRSYVSILLQSKI